MDTSGAQSQYAARYSLVSEQRTSFRDYRNLLRLRGRGRLLALLERPVILTRLNVAPDGRFVPETQDWESFWAPAHELANPQIDHALERLHAAWQDYIRSRFDRSLQREYCFQYFSLLDLVLATSVGRRDSLPWKRTLRAVVGFECFGIRAPAVDAGDLAAGTTTLRNPCYLLAKLRWPGALDDTQFLPLISPPDGESAGLYYHYRQYRLSTDSPMSLLLYVAAAPTHRLTSFRLVESLARGVASGGDPRVGQRARRLWDKVLRPIMQGTHTNPSEPMHFEFVDVGAGSGALVAALCRRLLAWSAARKLSPRLRVWFVDLCLADPARFFRAPGLRGRIDSLMFLGDDYRRWLARPGPLPARSGLRVALVSKLFNNLSHFSVCRCRTDVLSSSSTGTPFIDGRKHLPSSCLAPDGAGPEALLISSTRVDLAEGRTFAQASLSEYYRALRLALAGDGEDVVSADGAWLPLRALDPGCLIAADGMSVLARLLEHCDYLIVADADLRPKDIVEHLRAFSLDGLAALDMTKALGLIGNYAYLLSSKGVKKPSLPGERIW
jgi:hypothetical protein